MPHGDRQLPAGSNAALGSGQRTDRLIGSCRTATVRESVLFLQRTFQALPSRCTLLFSLCKVMAEATLSSKNQSVIPREAREALGVKAGDKLLVVVREDRVIILERPS